MAHANWLERRDVNCARIMDLLKACAEADKPCPTAGVIGRELKLSANMVVTLFDLLKAQGRIDWTVIYCGNAIGKRKWVTLVREGVKTGKPQSVQRSYVKAPIDDSLLARAKLKLQQRGMYVWRADVSEGSSYEGMIKVDRQILAPAQVIAMAGL